MPPTAPDPGDPQSLVGTKLGNYRLERIVGRGRMGVVYLATDEALLRRTAVKVLSWSMDEDHGQDPVQWFLAEARLVARINHPLVVQIYAVARHGDHRYIAMEYIDGPSAEALVHRDGPMDAGAATDVLAQVASALHAAHQAGVIHRDVKPANLLVAADGTAKLTDFGMALQHSNAEPAGPSLRVGTPYYTAPEIWMGAQATPATDVYALGATYFYLLTGRPPFTGKDIPTVQEAHLRSPVPDPRDHSKSVPPACAVLARRMLAKKPKDRFETADVISREAHRTIDVLGVSRGPRERRRTPPPSLPSPLDPRALLPPQLPPAPNLAARPPPMPEENELFGPLPTAPAGELLSTVLGFLRRPFTPVQAADCPYKGEPFAALLARLLGPLAAGPGATLAVAGPPGSGRSTLCRRAAAQLGRTRPVIGFDLAALADPGPLLSRLRRVASESAAAAAPALGAALESRIESLARARQGGRSPVVVLDGLGAPLVSDEEIARLVGSAMWSSAFSTVLVGPVGLVQRLAPLGPPGSEGRLSELALPPLDARQVADYVQSWISSARPPGAPAILFSPDAMLLLAHRAAGHLEAINCAAENMLLLAAAQARRLVTSWDAWAAPLDERWWGTASSADFPRRPAHWPNREVSALIDTCRVKAGLPRMARSLNNPP